MAVQVEIDGLGTVELDDGFNDLSPEDKNATIQEIIDSQNKPEFKGEKKFDWISDVTGTAGSILGAIGGSLVAPVAGTVAGGVAGGAAGGAFGEYLEGLIDTDRGRDTSDIGSTAISEGAFGLIPGAGGVLTKGGLRHGAKALQTINPFGKGIKLPSEQLIKGVAKLSNKQKKELGSSLLERVMKVTGKKHAQAGQEYIRVIMDGTPKAVDKLFKAEKGNPVFEKVVTNFYQELIENGVLRAGGLSAATRGLIEATPDSLDSKE